MLIVFVAFLQKQVCTQLEKPRRTFECRTGVEPDSFTVLELVLSLTNLGWSAALMPTGARLKESWLIKFNFTSLWCMAFMDCDRKTIVSFQVVSHDPC